jgi:hypothetical protein
MMDGEHGDSLPRASVRRMVVPAGNRKVEMPSGNYYPGVIDSLNYPGNIWPWNGGAIVNPEPNPVYIAFDGDRRIAAGDLRDVARAAKELLDRRRDASILVFDGMTSGPVDIDFRGTVADVHARLPGTASTPGTADDAMSSAPRGPGRPKLGVVAREITLLPRHWEWLAQQSGGASVALRKLVDEARRASEDGNRVRRAQDAAYRFMSAMAGDKPHCEDAIRALFAGDPARFEKLIAAWPADVRDHALMLAERAFRREPGARAG